MKSSKLIRRGALWGAVLAGLAWLVSFIVITVNSSTTGLVPTAFGRPSGSFDGYMHGLALLGTLGGLVGLYKLQEKRYGRMGRIGFFAAFTGDILALISLLLVILVRSRVVEQKPAISLTDPLTLGFGGMTIGFLILSLGFLLIGVAALGTETLPRWFAAALVLVFIIGVLSVGFSRFTLASYAERIILGLFWLVLAYLLWDARGSLPLRIRERPTENEDNDDEDEADDSLTKPISTWAPIIISTLGLSLTLLAGSTIGSVEPITPSGYGIIRDFPGAESRQPVPPNQDNIFIPLTWKNTTGSSVLLQEPRVVLTEYGQEGNLDGEQSCANNQASPLRLCFFLVGEHSDISRETMTSKRPALKDNILLEPHSVTQNVLVFRPVKYWDPNNTGDYWNPDNPENAEPFEFDIPGNKYYQVEIEYRRAPVDRLGRDVVITDRNDVVDEAKNSSSVPTWLRPLYKEFSLGREAIMNDGNEVTGGAENSLYAPMVHKPLIEKLCIPSKNNETFDWDYWTRAPGARDEFITKDLKACG